MDNLDDSENNAKISDSAYSNSCSNSQSRRSHSSKSTHSEGNSSGSSGYGGKPSTSGYSTNTLTQPPEKRVKEKDSKKKKSPAVDLKPDVAKIEPEAGPPEQIKEFEEPKEKQDDVPVTPPPTSNSHQDKGSEKMEISGSEGASCKEETGSGSIPLATSMSMVVSRPLPNVCPDSFSCVISMHDGVVMYTTPSITSTLGFPKDMWIGRSFLDFVHPRDRNIFALQITTGAAGPKNVNGMQETVVPQINTSTTMVCRLRRYRSMNTGFGVKDRMVAFMPFLLKLSFKNIAIDEGDATYLVIHATPFFSAFKMPHEPVVKAVPFVIRHTANGNVEYIDHESVPYLGYLPQELTGKDALKMYHPHDLDYLQLVYETIVKEGGVQRSKPYRMMAQNGDYIKLETEWTSFINPWSRKLEFVTGKHHIIEGPRNPDVFKIIKPDKLLKLNEEDEAKTQAMRENIVRIMNEVLTKPAAAAKQQMTKRCQDLAVFMESLMDEAPKTDDARLEIQDADLSYYERDSVMLGGISPHHDYDDCQFSMETPLSYNQLNYKDNLQRFFDSQAVTEEKSSTKGESWNNSGDSLSPLNGSMGTSSDKRNMCKSSFLSLPGSSSHLDYAPVRLTESMLSKHNAEMEKALVKLHREQRTCSKGEREKNMMETRQKKKEHLARCNASFQPTSASFFHLEPQPHGVKRSSRHVDSEGGSHKHHCSSQRQSRRWQPPNVPPLNATPPAPNSIATTWPAPKNNMNGFIVGVGLPQPMSIISPVAAMPSMIPMYYAPAATSTINSQPITTGNSTHTAPQFQQAPLHCMMYGQGPYPVVYTPMPAQMAYAVPHTFVPAAHAHAAHAHAANNMNMHMNMNSNMNTNMNSNMNSNMNMNMTTSMNPLGLAGSNYEQACKPSIPTKTKTVSGNWRNKKRSGLQTAISKTNQRSASCSAEVMTRDMAPESGNNGVKRKMEKSTEIKSADRFSPKGREPKPGMSKGRQFSSKQDSNSDEMVDKTDGESSSSFYSSFFKTESGSAEESDAKKAGTSNENKVQFWRQSQNEDAQSRRRAVETAAECYEQAKKIPRRKAEPAWMDEVCVTSELIYRYQVLTKDVDEVLSSDKQRLKTIEQPSLVNEQLGQLYLDLQLEGVAARLTLEEGITSPNSSSDEMTTKWPKKKKSSLQRKREYSKLVMIYEEDAPLPSPSDEGASSSTH